MRLSFLIIIGMLAASLAKAPLGADFSTLPKAEAAKLGVPGGVVVTRIYADGALGTQTRMRAGFVITRIGNSPVLSVGQLEQVLSRQQGTIRIQGIYPGSKHVYYYVVHEF